MYSRMKPGQQIEIALMRGQGRPGQAMRVPLPEECGGGFVVVTIPAVRPRVRLRRSSPELTAPAFSMARHRESSPAEPFTFARTRRSRTR